MRVFNKTKKTENGAASVVVAADPVAAATALASFGERPFVVGMLAALSVSAEDEDDEEDENEGEDRGKTR